jgi:hypothetical protein
MTTPLPEKRTRDAPHELLRTPGPCGVQVTEDVGARHDSQRPVLFVAIVEIDSHTHDVLQNADRRLLEDIALLLRPTGPRRALGVLGHRDARSSLALRAPRSNRVPRKLGVFLRRAVPVLAKDRFDRVV